MLVETLCKKFLLQEKSCSYRDSGFILNAYIQTQCQSEIHTRTGQNPLPCLGAFHWYLVFVYALVTSLKGNAALMFKKSYQSFLEHI